MAADPVVSGTTFDVHERLIPRGFPFPSTLKERRYRRFVGLERNVVIIDEILRRGFWLPLFATDIGVDHEGHVGGVLAFDGEYS